TFTVTVRLDALPAAPVSNTATIGAIAWDNDTGNNSATLTLFTEGQAFTNAVLYHFPAPSPAVTDPSQLLAILNWGDGRSNPSDDGTGAVAVVANANGGFDVLGSHTYAEEGNFALGVALTSILPGVGTLTPRLPVELAVTDAPLAAVQGKQIGEVQP